MILIIGKGIAGDRNFQRWLRSDFPLCHSRNIKSNWQPLASTISCGVYMIIRRKSCASNYFEFGPTKGRSVFFSKLQAKISKRSFLSLLLLVFTVILLFADSDTDISQDCKIEGKPKLEHCLPALPWRNADAVNAVIPRGAESTAHVLGPTNQT